MANWFKPTIKKLIKLPWFSLLIVSYFIEKYQLATFKKKSISVHIFSMIISYFTKEKSTFGAQNKKRPLFMKDLLQARHIGVSEQDEVFMLQTIGVKSLAELIDQTIPSSIRLEKAVELPEPLTERQYA